VSYKKKLFITFSEIKSLDSFLVLNFSDYFDYSNKLHNELILSHPWEKKANLKDVYEKLKQDLSFTEQELFDSLNSIHSVKFASDFWRIALGQFPMLVMVAIREIEAFIKIYSDDYEIFYEDMEINFSFRGMQDFTYSFQNQHFIHYFIFKELCLSYGFKGIKSNASIDREALANNKNIKETLKVAVNKFCKLLKPSIVICSEYYSILDAIKLSISLGFLCLPIFKIKYDRPIAINKSPVPRNFKSINLKTLFALMPDIFLYNLDSFISFIKKNSFIDAQLIINSVADVDSNDFMRFYLALSLSQKDCSLFTIQHGGVYGSNEFMMIEDIQKSNTPHFFSWGWRNNSFYNLHQKIRLPNVKYVNSRNKFITIVDTSFPAHYYHLFQSPQGTRQRAYFSKIANLYCSLSELSNVKIKLYNNYDIDRYQYFSPNVFSGSLKEAMQESKFFIVTYDSTAHLELFYSNFPTLLYFDENFYNFRTEARSALQDLKKANILFSDLDSLVNFIERNNYDLLGFWSESDTQIAVSSFIKKYANFGTDYLTDLRKKIKIYKELQ